VSGRCSRAGRDGSNQSRCWIQGPGALQHRQAPAHGHTYMRLRTPQSAHPTALMLQCCMLC
jgi:hypothetical protein